MIGTAISLVEIQIRNYMEKTSKIDTTMTEKDRWMLVAAICSAISTAITEYFSERK